MKQIIIISSALFVSFATISDLLTNGDYHDELPEIHASLNQSLSRMEQVLQCASCHPKAYENEMLGPHASSYFKLMEHIEHIQTSPHFDDHWRNGVNENLQKCLSCHAGANLYETSFSGLESETDEAKFTPEHFPMLHYPPPPRSDEASLLTGVDCLTCHVKNNKVITSATFRPSGIKMDGQCDVMPSKFFSHDLNCISCHRFTYFDAMKNVEKGLVKINDIGCLKCHQEYDALGKGTHYFYWKHDPPQKKRPHSMELFHCINITSKSEAGKRFIVFHWENNNAPHGYPDCAEYIVDVSWVSANDTIPLGSERINRKTDQAKSMKEVFKDDVPGISGYCNYMDSEPLYREYHLDHSHDYRSGKVLVVIKVKTQYWAGDPEAKVMESRMYDLE